MATETRNPTSDLSEVATITGAAAGSRWTLVDDHPDSAGADFYTHVSNSSRVTVGHSVCTVPAGSTAISVAVKYYDRASSALATCGAHIRVGGTIFHATEHAPAANVWTLRTDTWATNPATAAAWTVADVNGTGANPLAGFGTRAQDANPDVEIASLQLEVTYTAGGVSGSGSPSIGTVIVAAASTLLLNAASAAVVSGLASSAASALRITATGDLALGTLTVSSVGSLPVAGTASLPLGEPVATGTSTLGLAAEGTTALPGPSLSATGELAAQQGSGSAALTLGNPVLTASGTLLVSGDGLLVFGLPVASGTATVALAGQSAIQFGTLVVDGQGIEGLQGQRAGAASPVLPRLQTSATAELGQPPVQVQGGWSPEDLFGEWSPASIGGGEPGGVAVLGGTATTAKRGRRPGISLIGGYR